MKCNFDQSGCVNGTNSFHATQLELIHQKKAIANIQYLSYLSREHMEFMMTNKNSIQNLIFLKIWLFLTL